MVEKPGTAVLMFMAHRDVESRVMATIAREGFDDITIAQSRLMQRLDPAGMRLTELAEQARVTKQTAGALIDQLERAGYVTRLPDPTDARARLVTLSDKGAEVCRRANAEVLRVETEWRKQLGDRAFDAMRAALLKVNSV